jgi:hypothetical protein
VHQSTPAEAAKHAHRTRTCSARHP